MKEISDSGIRSDETEAGKKILIRFLTAGLIWTITITVHVFIKNNLVCGMVWIIGLIFLWLSHTRHRRMLSEKQQVNRKLSESEQKYRRIFLNLLDPVLLSSPTGEILDFNTAFLKMFGFDSREQAARSSVYDLYAIPENRPKFIQKIKENGYTSEYPLQMKRQDGYIMDGVITSVLIKGEDNSVKYFISIIRDITERKQMENKLRESEERFRLFMDNTPTLAWLKDTNGCYAYVNKFYEKRFGLKPEDWLGKTDFDLWDHHIAEMFQKNDQMVITTGQSAEFEESTGSPEDGFWITHKFLFCDALGRKFIGGIAADITERVYNEELRVANAALERSTRLKDEFLAAMSHELRTPLTGVLSLSEALLDEVYGTLNEKQQKIVRHVESSGQHLLELITDILDLSKIEAGQMELQIEKTSVSDICQSALQLIKGMADKKHHKVSFDMNPVSIRMNADPRRLKQMLLNLLSNAVKFTPDGGQIKLEVRGNESAQIVHFCISDTGIGIAPEKFDSLFRPFVQLDSSLSRQYSGTGLGLSLVKRMAELHGGTVNVESELGKGSIFTISLPRLKFEGVEYGFS